MSENRILWMGGGSFGDTDRFEGHGWANTFALYELPGIKAFARHWCRLWEATEPQVADVMTFCERMHAAFGNWLIEAYDYSTAVVTEPPWVPKLRQ